MKGGHLEEDELGAEGGLVEVHEGGELGQRDGRIQLEQLLQAGQVALLLHQAKETPQLQPVRLLRAHQTDNVRQCRPCLLFLRSRLHCRPRLSCMHCHACSTTKLPATPLVVKGNACRTNTL